MQKESNLKLKKKFYYRKVQEITRKTLVHALIGSSDYKRCNDFPVTNMFKVNWK